jgi:hypothetical protein
MRWSLIKLFDDPVFIKRRGLQFFCAEAIVTRMNHLRKTLSLKGQQEDSFEKLGGEPLDGSGFEHEKPDEGFSGAVLLDSTFVPLSPIKSQ